MTALAEHRAFLSSIQDRQSRRRALIDAAHAFPEQPTVTGRGTPPLRRSVQEDNAEAGPSKLKVVNYVSEEETVRNDYPAWYGVSGRWGSEYVHGAAAPEICEEYPALRRLMDLKAEMVDATSHPPLYAQIAPGSPSAITSPQQTTTLSSSIAHMLGPNRFDTIILTPPADMPWSEIAALPIRQISSDPGFVFLWVGKGSEDGLEKGRECFVKWGFRRAEDIVWVKVRRKGGPGDLDDPAKTGDQAMATGGTAEDTSGKANTEGTGPEQSGDTLAAVDGDGLGGVFAGQKEHCLMGIRGTVRRSTDSHFVHCNVDTDIMLWEEDGVEGHKYPPYLHTLVENFCLGTRRLHLFGKPQTTRRGWVTLGHPAAPEPGQTPEQGSMPAESQAAQMQPFDAARYATYLASSGDGRHVLPYQPEIDNLRPKSPVRKGRPLPGGNGPPHGSHGQHQQQGRQHPGSARYDSPQQGGHGQMQPFMRPPSASNTRSMQHQYSSQGQSRPSQQQHQPHQYQAGAYYGGDIPQHIQVQMHMQQQARGFDPVSMGGMGFDPMQLQFQMQMAAQAQAQAQMQMQLQLQQMQYMQMMMGAGGGGGTMGYEAGDQINFAGAMSPGTYQETPQYQQQHQAAGQAGGWYPQYDQSGSGRGGGPPRAGQPGQPGADLEGE